MTDHARTGLLGSATVLLVEDDVATREILATILACHGARVFSSGSVADALQQLERLEPSLLISDIGLPDDDGYALIDCIRRREGRGHLHLPAVAISGFAGDVAQRARAAGFDEFLAKPIDTEALLRLLGQLAPSPPRA